MRAISDLHVLTVTERREAEMSGNKEGGAKTAITLKRKYGPDYFKRIGAMGGSAPYEGKKGFAADNRTILNKLFRKPKTAKIAGQIGGRISKRTKKES